MKTGPSTLPRTWWRRMVNVPAPVARAASTKSRLLTCAVAVSATRHIAGVHTNESAIMPLAMPPPIAPWPAADDGDNTDRPAAQQQRDPPAIQQSGQQIAPQFVRPEQMVLPA